jgi:hypothetical protein
MSIDRNEQRSSSASHSHLGAMDDGELSDESLDFVMGGLARTWNGGLDVSPSMPEHPQLASPVAHVF